MKRFWQLLVLGYVVFAIPATVSAQVLGLNFAATDPDVATSQLGPPNSQASLMFRIGITWKPSPEAALEIWSTTITVPRFQAPPRLPGPARTRGARAATINCPSDHSAS